MFTTTFQELHRELASSKEETEMYLHKYNALLEQVDSYRKEKEKAEHKLERYSEWWYRTHRY